MLELKLLLLLIVANGAPVLGKRYLGQRWDSPVDFGATLADGQPLFGASKTWRGVLLGIGGAALVALLCGLPIVAAVIIAAAALCGDLLSSFIKRRLQRPPSSSMPLLDQIPESLFPLLLGMALLDYPLRSALLVCLAFVLMHILLSPLLHRLGIRLQPH